MSAKKRKFDEISSDESEQETTAEEQVLSHAAQRRLQKRLKTVVTDNATGEKGGPAASIATRTNNSNPGVHSIWVGNLAFKTTPDALKGFLGNMEDIKRIHMPTKALHGTHSNTKGARGDNRGFVLSISY
jgi:RNA recognition motif-containing protein